MYIFCSGARIPGTAANSSVLARIERSKKYVRALYMYFHDYYLSITPGHPGAKARGQGRLYSDVQGRLYSESEARADSHVSRFCSVFTHYYTLYLGLEPWNQSAPEFWMAINYESTCAAL